MNPLSVQIPAYFFLSAAKRTEKYCRKKFIRPELSQATAWFLFFFFFIKLLFVVVNINSHLKDNDCI